MKKSMILAAAAAFVLASCAKNEIVNYANVDEVSFGAYSGRTITKAGATDDINLKALATHGFGVFATYSGTADFSAATDDFMYNQGVFSADEGTTWTYTPIKYWPNPTNGQSADLQKVSFFAYAPFCEPGTSETTGITGFAIEGGHDIVNYAFAKDAANVDLMWGYETGTDPKAANLNKTRTPGTVKFTFRHLLSKLGGSQEGIQDPEDPAYVANGLIIKADPTVDPVNGFGTDNGTKITVSAITVESAPADGVLTDANGNVVSYASGTQTGKLDLYTGKFTLDSATPEAIQFSQALSADATAVAAGASEIADFLKEVPSPADFASVKKGVTKTAVNVYKDESNPIILIPGTAPVVNVTITYVVRTYDAKLGTKKYSEVPQTVFGQVKFPTIEENKKYNLLIILGLNDVKFEATVEDWSLGRADISGPAGVPDGVIDGYDDVTVWLRENL